MKSHRETNGISGLKKCRTTPISTPLGMMATILGANKPLSSTAQNPHVVVLLNLDNIQGPSPGAQNSLKRDRLDQLSPCFLSPTFRRCLYIYIYPSILLFSTTHRVSLCYSCDICIHLLQKHLSEVLHQWLTIQVDVVFSPSPWGGTQLHCSTSTSARLELGSCSAHPRNSLP